MGGTLKVHGYTAGMQEMWGDVQWVCRRRTESAQKVHKMCVEGVCTVHGKCMGNVQEVHEIEGAQS